LLRICWLSVWGPAVSLRKALGFFCAAVAASASAKAEPVVLTTLEWPPYVSESLPESGAVGAVVKDLFAAAGHSVDFHFVLWNRAIALAASDDTVVAYFPGYSCDHAPGFTASRPVGSGPLGLIERRDAPITWSSLDDLVAQDVRLGVVKGYKNGAAFDARVAAGDLTTFAVPDDETNLLQLTNGRVDAVVMDPGVMQLLTSTSPKLLPSAGRLVVNKTLLDSQTMYVCFSDAPKGAALRAAFDAAAKDINPEAVIDAYMREEFQ